MVSVKISHRSRVSQRLLTMEEIRETIVQGAHDNHGFVRLLNGETEIPLSNETGGVLSMQTRDAPREFIIISSRVVQRYRNYLSRLGCLVASYHGAFSQVALQPSSSRAAII